MPRAIMIAGTEAKVRLWPRWVPYAVLAFDALLIGSARVQAGSSRPLALLPLQATEVPAGFQQYQAYVFTNADEARVDGVTLPVVQALGRVTGYQIVYARSANSGVCCITSQVSVWRNWTAAQRAYYWHIADSRRMFRSFPGFQQLTGWRGELSIQAFTCDCPGGAQEILKVRTYRDRYYVFTQVNFKIQGAHPERNLALAVDETAVVLSRLP